MVAESFSDERLDKVLDELKPVFMKRFDVTSSEDVEWLLFTFAPGRINFIGEHVDYLGGWVCPAAVTEGTHILVGRVKHLQATDEKPKLRFFATYNEQRFEMESISSGNDHCKDWKTYVRGAVTLRLEELGMDVNSSALGGGLCFVLHSTLAMGAGMSASAAFSVGLIHSINAIATGAHEKSIPAIPGRRYSILPRLETAQLVNLAKQARRVEIEFCGVNVGIMDQFASALSQSGEFMFLDCLSCEHTTYSLEPLLKDDHCFLLIDSMNKHELAGGNAGVYNQVRKDQEEAERKVTEHVFHGKKKFTFSAFVRNLEEFNTDGHHYTEDNRLAIMNEAKPYLSQGEYERGCYQLTEQERTLAFKRLNDGSVPDMPQAERLRKVGDLLNKTHEGLRDWLRVSTTELDFIHSVVNENPDVYGGRVMGAGFGGCLIVLLKKSAQERVLSSVRSRFLEKFNVENVAYPVERLGCGAFTVSLVS